MTNIIQSIQPFTVSLSTATTAGTAAITAVDPAKSVIIPSGVRSNGTNVNLTGAGAVNLTLTSSVLVTAERGQVSVTSHFIHGTVVEFANFVNSIQQGSLAVTTGTTGGTVSISAVSTRAFVVYQGSKVDNTATSWSGIGAGVTLNNSTQVGVVVTPSSVGITVRFAVVDLSSHVVESVEQINFEAATAATVDTATIASIDPGRTLVFDGGQACTGLLAASMVGPNLQGYYPLLAGPTSVQFTRFSSVNTATRRHLASVVQFTAQALASTVKRGTLTATSASSVATSTIAAVSTRSFVNSPIFQSRMSSASQPGGAFTAMTLAATLVTLSRGATLHTVTAAYEILEWQTSIAIGGATTSVGSGLVYGNLLSGHVRSPVNRAHYISQGSV